MPFIPHTEEQVREMLGVVGAGRIEDLFDEIPAALRTDGLGSVPEGLGEMDVARIMRHRAAGDEIGLNFIGAGAYEHHIPAAVWEIVTRGEFYTAYTPYQPEASQGTLQVIYEFQSMMAALTGMEVSNASLYDGASALAEAVLMAVRANRKSRSRRILMPRTVHPAYRATVRAIVGSQDIELVEVPFDPETGQTTMDALERRGGEDFAALVVPQPNFFGVLEEVDAMTGWARAQGMLVIALVNPVSLALLNEPGRWAEGGADIVTGEGQPLGVPLSSGGPYFGFLCTRKSLVRQMPGRLVGRTLDADGKPGFVLTLQAREQHIRRSKATSNICTNQGLMVTAATIHMALLGADGLQRVATACHGNAHALAERLCAMDGVEPAFTGPFFHEAALRLERPVGEVLGRLADRGILGGYPLGETYPELTDGLLVCATETRTQEDLDRYASEMAAVLGA